MLDIAVWDNEHLGCGVVLKKQIVGCMMGILVALCYESLHEHDLGGRLRDHERVRT
jgi:hypothetical protein